MDIVVIKNIDGKDVPYLSDLPLVEGEKIKAEFSDCHHEIGNVIIDYDRHGNETAFIEVSYHGRKPWVKLTGMPAKRV